MRIAFIGAKRYPGTAGGDRVVAAIATRLARENGNEVTVFVARPHRPSTTAHGVRVLPVRALPGKHLRPTTLFLFAAMRALVGRRQDVVHVHHVEACFVVPLLRLRSKVVATSHGPAHERGKWHRVAKSLIRAMEWPFARLPHAVTCVSHTHAVAYEAKYRRPVEYIPNGVDSPLDGHVRAAADDLIVFAAGRIIPTKGCGLLLDAFRRVPHDVRLLVIGDARHYPGGPAALRARADGRVEFREHVDSVDELRRHLQRARFLVFPSSVEAMSMMLLEAAAWGVPVLCSDLEENAIALGGAATTFRSGNARDLADKLCWALEHPADLEVLAHAAREHVRREHRWDEIVGAYRAIYRAVVTEGDCTGASDPSPAHEEASREAGGPTKPADARHFVARTSRARRPPAMARKEPTA